MGCPAMEGFNQIHAVLGTSEKCIATNPSDMNVALTALDGVVRVQSARGEPNHSFEQFHLAPGDAPERETVLEKGDSSTRWRFPLVPSPRTAST